MRWIHGMEQKLISNDDIKNSKFPVACTFNQPDVEDNIIRNTYKQ